MKFTLIWLSKHINHPLLIEDVIEALNNLSIEVDQVTTIGGDGYYVAKIIDIQPHPNSNKLNLCKVEFLKNGNIEFKTVVCGASNVYVGMHTILAEVGTTLPCGITLTSRKIRDVVSDGMLLSYGEFGLKHIKQEGIIDAAKELLEELIKKDYIITIGIPANRIDLSSIRSLAEELSCYFSYTLNGLYKKASEEKIKSTKPVKVTNKDFCKMFSTIEIDNFHTRDNYQEILALLTKIQNPTEVAIVNIGNFITADLGVPLHVYDKDKINGLEVTVIQQEENFQTINGNDIVLKPNYLVINDINNDKPLVLAGIIGGQHSRCTEQTKNVLIEAAIFNKAYFTKAYRDINIQNNSTYYFNRGINISNYLLALEYFREFVNGQFSHLQIINNAIESIGYKEIFLAYEEFYKITEIAISLQKIASIIELYGYKTEIANKDTEGLNQEMGLIVQIPNSKCHINNTRDLIEEIVRLGYAHKTLQIPYRDLSLSIKKIESPIDIFFKIQDCLVFNGYKEIISFPFTEKVGSKDELYIPNAIGHHKYLRSGLTNNLKEYMDNIIQSKMGIECNGNLFEISKVFYKSEDKIKEHYNIALGIINNIHKYNTTNMKQEAVNIVAKLGKLLNIDNIRLQWNKVLLEEKVIGNISYSEKETYMIIEIENLNHLLNKKSKSSIQLPQEYEEICRDYSCIMTEEQFELIYYKELKKHKNISYSLFDHYNNSYGIRVKYLVSGHNTDITPQENGILKMFQKNNVILR